MDKLFTPLQKDKVIEILFEICATRQKMNFSIHSGNLGILIGMNPEFTEALLRDFVYKGLIKMEYTSRYEWWIELLVPFFDLKNRGGFVAIEEIASIELEKLALEMRALEKTIEPAKYERIMTTIQTLASAIGVFTS